MLLRNRIVSIIVVIFIIACRTANADDIKIGRFAATPDGGWNANAFWLEGDEGIVLIDALLLIEDAKLWSAMLKSLNKPVKAMVITHYHHDHTGGINTLLKELGPFPIYSSKGTADTHEASNKYSYGFTTRKYGDRFDTKLVKPDHLIIGKEEIEIAGIKLTIEDIGPGESMNATVIYQPDLKALFSGDATVHHTVPYTTESRSMEMLRQLRHLKETYKDVDLVYSGHGDPAPLAHIDQQIDYIEFSQNLAKGIIAKKDYKDPETGEIDREIIDKYSHIIMDKFKFLTAYGFPQLQMTAQNLIGIIREFEK